MAPSILGRFRFSSSVAGSRPEQVWHSSLILHAPHAVRQHNSQLDTSGSRPQSEQRWSLHNRHTSCETVWSDIKHRRHTEAEQQGTASSRVRRPDRKLYTPTSCRPRIVLR